MYFRLKVRMSFLTYDSACEKSELIFKRLPFSEMHFQPMFEADNGKEIVSERNVELYFN